MESSITEGDNIKISICVQMHMSTYLIGDLYMEVTSMGDMKWKHMGNRALPIKSSLLHLVSTLASYFLYCLKNTRPHS